MEAATAQNWAVEPQEEIGFTAHLQHGITSNYDAEQITITHTNLFRLLQPPLFVARLQSSNMGYSSRPHASS
jgi:hypothetical protein